MKSEQSTPCTQESNPKFIPKWKDALAKANVAPRCGAKTRRGTACQSPAMANSRCRMHGGSSNGPITEEGREKAAVANWKHGFYSKTAKEQRGKIATLLRQCYEILS